MKYSTFFSAVIFLLTLSLFSCENGTSSEQAADPDSPFSVRDPNYLFFKNTRAYYYTESLAPGGKPSQRMNVYQLRKFSNRTDRPIIYPKIIDNWFEDEAYLFLEANEYPVTEPLTVFMANGQDTSTFRLDRPTPPMQWQLAEQIANALDQEHKLFVLDTAGQQIPLFENKNDQIAFLTTIKDFRKLTE